MNYPNWMPKQKMEKSKADSYFYNLMLRYLLNKETPTITVAQLRSLFDHPLLLDIRKKEEYNISHLPKAINPGYNNFDASALFHIPKEKPIVAYCSVGYRSEKIVNQLLSNGFKNVYNLYGGIFEWINNGYPIFDDQGITENVHVYNWAWGIWLQRGQKMY